MDIPSSSDLDQTSQTDAKQHDDRDMEPASVRSYLFIYLFVIYFNRIIQSVRYKLFYIEVLYNTT